jgi:Putative metallopeptidase
LLFDFFLHFLANHENTVKVVYHPTQVYADEMAYLKSLGALEDVAETLSKEFMVKPGITVEADECNEPNAYWYREDRSLKICYELIYEFHTILDGVSKK